MHAEVILSAFLLLFGICFVFSLFSNSSINDSDPYDNVHLEFERKKVIQHVNCPHCRRTFIPNNNNILNVKKTNMDNDIAYVICPFCGEKIRISEYHVGYFDHQVDKFGNIIEGPYSQIDNTVYTVTCPSCGLPHHFRGKDVFIDSHSNKRYIYCKTIGCQKKIILKKSNTKIDDYLN